MTTQPARKPVNKIIVVGPLDSINRDGEVVQGQFRPTQINIDRFRLQMSSPLLGEGFGLAVSVDRTVPGADLIEEARRNKGKGRQTLVAIEGTLLIRTGFDARFRDRTDPDDRGRQVREPVLQATCIRAATAADMDLPSSVVWLEGEVLEPPRFLYHPTLPNVQIASTVVSVIRDLAVPGSRAVMRQRIQVRVAIPVEHAHAAWLYCMGNQVRIEGQLECFMERQSGMAVNRTVAALDATWQEEQPRLKGDALLRAERAYRRERQRLLEDDALMVIAGFVEPLNDEAQEITIPEARKQRREYGQRIQQRRADRQAQRDERDARQAPVIADNAPPPASVSSEASALSTAPAPVERPRPRRQRAETAGGALPAPVRAQSLADYDASSGDGQQAGQRLTLDASPVDGQDAVQLFDHTAGSGDSHSGADQADVQTVVTTDEA